MSAAKKLLSTFEPKDSVHVDYLCFTFKLKDLRHCHKALSRDADDSNFRFKKEKSLLKRHATAPRFPSPPEFNPMLAKSSEDIEALTAFYHNQCQLYLEDCLKIFANQVLGLSLSAPRGLSFNFYTDSMKLTSPNGDDFCGFVGIGGNENTVHFQINGTGCKHLFERRPPWSVHDWLSNVLGVTTLARVDLAYDDFDGIFDCDYAMKAVYDDAFRTAVRGRSPSVEPDNRFTIDFKTGNKIFSKEQLLVGSRSSRVYWRIYNKALEQNLAESGLIWYRSEAELKKWDVDVLLDPCGAFAAINDFSASISTSKPFNTKRQPTKHAALDLLNQVYWMKKQYGKILNSLLASVNGDVEKALGMVIRDGTSFSLPDTHGALINHILET